MPFTTDEIDKKAETIVRQALAAGQTSIEHWSDYPWPEGVSERDANPDVKYYM